MFNCLYNNNGKDSLFTIKICSKFLQQNAFSASFHTTLDTNLRMKLNANEANLPFLLSNTKRTK